MMMLSEAKSRLPRLSRYIGDTSGKFFWENMMHGAESGDRTLRAGWFYMSDNFNDRFSPAIEILASLSMDSGLNASWGHDRKIKKLLRNSKT
jgi:hypothetical protein